MDASRTIALIIFLFPLAYSPGPGNAFFASVGASEGMRGAMPSLLGYHVATFIVTMLVGLWTVSWPVADDKRQALSRNTLGKLPAPWLVSPAMVLPDSKRTGG